MSLIKQLAGETVIYGLSSIVGRLLNFLLVPLYTTWVFSTGEYGVVTDFYAWVGLLIVFFTYRMETGFFRFGTPKEDRDTAYSTVSISLLITTPILCGILIFLAQPIADWMTYPDHPEYVVWFALILGFDALAAIPFARLRLDSRPWRFAGIKLFNIALNIGGNLFLLLGCPYLIEQGWDIPFFNPDNMIAYVFLSNLFASAATLLLLSPTYLKIKLIFDKALLINILRYTGPLVIVGFAGVINEVLDRTLLKFLLPYSPKENLELLGIYGASYKMAMLMTLFTQAFNYAAEPFFFKNADRSDSKKTYAKVAQLFTIIGTIAFLGILFYIDIFQFFIGEEFREGLVIVPVLLMANLCLGLYYNFSIWYKLTDKTSIGAYIAVFGAFITITLNVWWIPIFEYQGSAWATLCCYLFMSIACYWAGQKYHPIPYPVKKIVLYIGLALLFYAISLPIRTYFGSGTILLFIANTLLLGSYIYVIYRTDVVMFNTMLFKKPN